MAPLGPDTRPGAVPGPDLGRVINLTWHDLPLHPADLYSLFTLQRRRPNLTATAASTFPQVQVPSRPGSADRRLRRIISRLSHRTPEAWSSGPAQPSRAASRSGAAGQHRDFHSIAAPLAAEHPVIAHSVAPRLLVAAERPSVASVRPASCHHIHPNLPPTIKHLSRAATFCKQASLGHAATGCEDRRHPYHDPHL